jgi:hypothetical protein
MDPLDDEELTPLPEPEVREPTRGPPGAHERWSGCMTYTAQVAAGVGVCCASTFIPGGFCAAPAATGFVQAWIGDRYGPTRGTMVVPTIANYLVSAVGGIGVGFAYFSLITSFNGGGFGLSPDETAFMLLGAFTVTVVAAPMVSAGAYHLFSEPKREGDWGQGDPGMTAPAHPPETKKKRAPQLVMRF